VQNPKYKGMLYYIWTFCLKHAYSLKKSYLSDMKIELSCMHFLAPSFLLSPLLKIKMLNGFGMP
jgi:hypothetical protein